MSYELNRDRLNKAIEQSLPMTLNANNKYADFIQGAGYSLSDPETIYFIAPLYSSSAYKQAEYLYPDDLNAQDIARHALWNMLLTQAFGMESALKITTAYEELTPNNPALSKEMDLYNNKIAANVANNRLSATDDLQDIVKPLAKELISKGYFKYINTSSNMLEYYGTRKAYCITSVAKALKTRTNPAYNSAVDGSINCFEEVAILREEGPFSLVKYTLDNGGTKQGYFYSDNFELLENRGLKYITNNNHKWYNPYIDAANKTQSFNDIETRLRGHLAHDINVNGYVVKAIFKGTIVFAGISGCGKETGFINTIGNQIKSDAPDNGTMVVIEHKIGSVLFYTSYSHLKKDSFFNYNISVGSSVDAGTPIGTMSGSGAVKDEPNNKWYYSDTRFGDHLHLALYTSESFSKDPYGYNSGGSNSLYPTSTEADCIKNANAYVWKKANRNFYDFRKIIDDDSLIL